jgi:hypothetical protein
MTKLIFTFRNFEKAPKMLTYVPGGLYSAPDSAMVIKTRGGRAIYHGFRNFKMCTEAVVNNLTEVVNY